MLHSKRKHAKSIAMLLAVALLISLIPSTAFANDSRSESVIFVVDLKGYSENGQWVDADAAPYIQDNRTMVPVAFAARALGSAVYWDGETRQVTIEKEENTITMTIGHNQLYKNGQPFDEMDTVAVIQDIGNGLGRTMVPISRIAKALDVEYHWDANSRSVEFYVTQQSEEVVVFDEPGTYGPDDYIDIIEKNVKITSPDVTLKNTIIRGDLIIAEEVSDGDVYLENVSVEGETYIRGGGTDSIHIKGGSIKNIIVEETSSGAVRIYITDAEGTEIIIAETAKGQSVILEGNFNKVTVKASGMNIETKGDTVIKQIQVEEQATDSKINVSENTVVEKITTDAKLSLNNEGQVKELEGSKAGDTETEGTAPEKTTTPSSTGGGGGGGGGSTPPPADPDDEDDTVTPPVEGEVTISRKETVSVLPTSKIKVEENGSFVSVFALYFDGTELSSTVNGEITVASAVLVDLTRLQVEIGGKMHDVTELTTELW